MGLVDLTPVINAPWFQLPHFYSPVFNLDAILIIAPAALVVLAEHIGHLVVTGNIVDRNLFIGKLSELIHSIPVPVMGGVCILLFGVIAASGLRVLVESKVDYSKSSNLVMTAVIMIIGLSGAKLTFGTISVQGMVLATLVAILLSVTFKILDRLGFLNHI